MLELDLERVIISNLFNNATYRTTVFPYLKTEYFTVPESTALFNIFSKYFLEYKEPPSLQTMVLEMKKVVQQPVLQETFDYLISAVQLTTAQNAKWLNSQTENWCKQRALYQAIHHAIDVYNTPNLNVLELESLPSLINNAIHITFEEQLGYDYFADAGVRYDEYTNPASKISSGIKILDYITDGGVEPKTLNMVIGKIHGGKTLTLIALGAAYLRAGYDVLYITLEMSTNMIMRRFDMNLLNLSKTDIARMPKKEFQERILAFKENNPNFGSLKIKEYPSGTASADNFGTFLDTLADKDNWRPKVILVDYVGLMRPANASAIKSSNPNYIFKEIATELRALAYRYDAAIWSGHQFNRQGQNNEDPVLTEIADAISIGEVSDFMLALLRSEKLDAERRMEYKQLKNRYENLGKTPKITLSVNSARNLISDLDEAEPLTGESGVFDMNTGEIFDVKAYESLMG